MQEKLLVLGFFLLTAIFILQVFTLLKIGWIVGFLGGN